MTRRIRIPVTGGCRLYVSAGNLIDAQRVGTVKRYQRTSGSGVTLRLIHVRGRFAVLVQTFRVRP